jgi:hypothetical protein
MRSSQRGSFPESGKGGVNGVIRIFGMATTLISRFHGIRIEQARDYDPRGLARRVAGAASGSSGQGWRG